MPAPNPLSAYTPGSSLLTTRQFSFGGYVFPLTTQMKSNNLKLASDKKHIPFNYGDHIPPNSSVSGREINLILDVGSMIVGSSGNTLSTAADLRAERNQLAQLQIAGRQQLWVSDERFVWAYLSEFNDQPFQDGGLLRYSTWDLKFIADDPRYYSTTAHEYDFGSIGDTNAHAVALTQTGNVRCYPRVLITANGTNNTAVACVAPGIVIANNLGSISVAWSGMTMYQGDTLSIHCDPRPEHRAKACVFTTKGVPTNGFPYINVVNDLKNTLDFSEIFPYIETTAIGGTSQFGVQMLTSNANGYTCSVFFNDTWL